MVLICGLAMLMDLTCAGTSGQAEAAGSGAQGMEDDEVLFADSDEEESKQDLPQGAMGPWLGSNGPSEPQTHPLTGV